MLPQNTIEEPEPEECENPTLAAATTMIEVEPQDSVSVCAPSEVGSVADGTNSHSLKRPELAGRHQEEFLPASLSSSDHISNSEHHFIACLQAVRADVITECVINAKNSRGIPQEIRFDFDKTKDNVLIAAFCLFGDGSVDKGMGFEKLTIDIEHAVMNRCKDLIGVEAGMGSVHTAAFAMHGVPQATGSAREEGAGVSHSDSFAQQTVQSKDKELTDVEDSKVNWHSLGWPAAKRIQLSSDISKTNSEKGVDEVILREQRDAILLLQRSLAYLIPKVTEDYFPILGDWCKQTTEAVELFRSYHNIQNEKGVVDAKIWDKLADEVKKKDEKEAKKKEDRLKDQLNRQQEKLQRKEHRNFESSETYKNMMDACQVNLGAVSASGKTTVSTADTATSKGKASTAETTTSNGTALAGQASSRASQQSTAGSNNSMAQASPPKTEPLKSQPSTPRATSKEAHNANLPMQPPQQQPGIPSRQPSHGGHMQQNASQAPHFQQHLQSTQSQGSFPAQQPSGQSQGSFPQQQQSGQTQGPYPTQPMQQNQQSQPSGQSQGSFPQQQQSGQTQGPYPTQPMPQNQQSMPQNPQAQGSYPQQMQQNQPSQQGAQGPFPPSQQGQHQQGNNFQQFPQQSTNFQQFPQNFQGLGQQQPHGNYNMQQGSVPVMQQPQMQNFQGLPHGNYPMQQGSVPQQMPSNQQWQQSQWSQGQQGQTLQERICIVELQIWQNMQIAADWDLPRLEDGKGLCHSYYPPLRFPWMGRENSPGKMPDRGTVPLLENKVDMLRRSLLPQDDGFDAARRPALNGSMDMLRRPAPNGSMDMLRRSPLPQDNGFDAARRPAPNDSMDMLRRSPLPQDNGFDTARRPAPNDSMEMLRPSGFDVGTGQYCTGYKQMPAAANSSLDSDMVRTSAAANAGAMPEVDVEVRGTGSLPEAWRSWPQVTFPPRVRAPLVSAGFPAPTPIQQHSWPILSGGRDLIGIAKTGSGKTLAFLMPIFAQLLESRADLRGPPAALVLAPTRELAVQIESEAKRFGETAGMRAACLYGGAPKGPQLAELRQRPQLLVATPGRLNDLLEPPAGLSVAVDVKSVRYLVLDEADRMLDMGFEPQIRKIISGLPKERQTVMFTATWPLSIRRLAADFLQNPVEVRAGEVDELRVNADITQQVVFCSDMRQKEEWLDKILRESGQDQCIVFVNTKRMCEVVSLRTPNSMAIHGDKDWNVTI
eukprot:s194_g8.t5